MDSSYLRKSPPIYADADGVEQGGKPPRQGDKEQQQGLNLSLGAVTMLRAPVQDPSSRPYLRISGQSQATASTTRIVPTPPDTTEIIAPVAIVFPSAGPNQ